MKKLNYLSLFSGIGAPERALENLGIDFNLVNYCEIDKYASKAYALLHNVSENLNLHDVTKIDDLDCLCMPNIDLITYGFPCQDISLAGYQKGLEFEGKKTRSGLVWDAHRIIGDAKPKIAICENVKNLVSKKFSKEFQAILDNLEEMGYNNYWQVLNAKDFGVPQNRERVFIVSIRKDVDKGTFQFPAPFPLQLRLKDMLEDEVDEKYYFSSDNLEWLKQHNAHHEAKGTGFHRKPVDANGVAHTLRANASFAPTDNSIVEEPKAIRLGNIYNNEKFTGGNFAGNVYDSAGETPALRTMQGGGQQPHIVVKTNNSKGFDVAKDGDYLNIEHPSSSTRRGRVGHQVSQTLDTSSSNHCVVVNEEKLRVRKLTPFECFALMGFKHEDGHMLSEAGISNTQLYKLAGNSIVVDVLENIFKKLYKDGD